MRRGLVAANWKMHGLSAENARLLDAILAGLEKTAFDEADYDVVICPPSIYLPEVQARLKGSRIGLGAQNVHDAGQGAFTGELSVPMLKEFACDYVIVGHSERRELFGEQDSFIARKVASLLKNDVVPILCIGETLEQREAGETEDVVLGQLSAVLDRNEIASFRHAVIAYEPVWAIGTGRTATPEQAGEVHKVIRAFLADRDRQIADETVILYGGSVKASNAAELFATEGIDGALVGGASLDPDEFLAICAAMQDCRQRRQEAG